LGFTFRYDRDLHGRKHRYLNVPVEEVRQPHTRAFARVAGLLPTRWFCGSFYTLHG
jgi:hypothetical protein